MIIYLIRHGKSDKSLQNSLSHKEFEQKRPLVKGGERKARQLGKKLKNQVSAKSVFELVHSGKVRSRQTAIAIAQGLGLSNQETQKFLKEDRDLAYQAEESYWKKCKSALKSKRYNSHAEFFLNNPPPNEETYSASYMREGMRSVLKKFIERNRLLNNKVIVMVSHEPVISLCLSDLSGKTVAELKGESTELEYARFIVISKNKSMTPEVILNYRELDYKIGSKLF